MQGKELQVRKKRVGRYAKSFRQMAVDRMRNCENIGALAEELGVHRRLLYKWRDQLEPVGGGEDRPCKSPEGQLRQQVTGLRRLCSETTVEWDFFQCALHKIRARPPRRDRIV